MTTRVGYIDYLNSLPIYHGLETGAVPKPAGIDLVKAMIDVFPEEFPRRKQSRRPSRPSGGDHGHHH